MVRWDCGWGGAGSGGVAGVVRGRLCSDAWAGAEFDGLYVHAPLLEACCRVIGPAERMRAETLAGYLLAL